MRRSVLSLPWRWMPIRRHFRRSPFVLWTCSLSWRQICARNANISDMADITCKFRRSSYEEIWRYHCPHGIWRSEVCCKERSCLLYCASFSLTDWLRLERTLMSLLFQTKVKFVLLHWISLEMEIVVSSTWRIHIVLSYVKFLQSLSIPNVNSLAEALFVIMS